MANRNKGMPLKKFKSFACKALRMERERTELESQLLNAVQPNKVQRDPVPDNKCILPQEPLPVQPLSPKRPFIKPQMLLRPSSQPPIGRKDLPTTRPSSHSGDFIFKRLTDDNALPRQVLDINKSNTMPSQIRRSADSQMDSRRPLNDHIYRVNANAQHRRQVKKLHEHAHRHVRAATAAAAAAAASVVAQLRKDAIDAVARQQAPYMRMAAIASATANVGSGNNSYGHKAQNEQRRLIRNSNLLSSALSIIREMDPAFLETLCYAIHDQVTKDVPSDSE